MTGRQLKILILVLLLFWPFPAMALDCGQMKIAIKKERNLLKKKQQLQEALASCNQDAELHYMAGYSFERLRKYNQALSHYLKATELARNYSKAYFGLGDIYMILGNSESAITSYRQGLAHEPDNSRAEASLQLAQIKYKSEFGERITSTEFIRVMQESKSRQTTGNAIDGPILRMQIHFLVSSASLSPQARKQLDVVGEALTDKVLAGQMFEIAGHTDDSGSTASNLNLSKERAEEVKKYLVKNYAIDPARLRVTYFGDTRPAVSNSSAENRARNRRVEFKKILQ